MTMADDKVSTASVDPRSAGAPVPEQVPILPLRDTVLFPQSVLPLGAGRASSLRLIEDVGAGKPPDRRLHPARRLRRRSRRRRICTGSAPWPPFTRSLKQPDGTVRLVVQGLRRFRIVEMTQVRPYLVARIAEEPEITPPAGDLETEALVRNAANLFRQVVELSPMLPDELATVVQNVTAARPARRRHRGLAARAHAPQVKQELLETPDVKARLARLVAALTKEAEVLELGSKIQSQVESEVGKSQREYYLREQLKAIQKELGGSRRAHPGARRAPREDRGGRHDRGGEEGGAAGARPSGQDAARGRRVHGGADVPRLAARAAVEQADDGQPRHRGGAAGPRRGPLGSGEGQGPDPRVPGGEDDAPGGQGPDPVLRRPSRRGQDLARPVDRAGARAQVPPHLARRHARRGRDPRSPADLHRRPARPDHPGPAARRVEEPGVHAGRDRQARHGLPRRSRPRRCWRCSIRSRTWRSGTTTSTWRSISPRSCSSRPPTCWTRCRRRCGTGWRSSRSRATPRRRRSPSRGRTWCRSRSPITA